MIDEKKLKKELAELSLKCPYSVLDERFALYAECFEKAICLLKEQPKIGEWIPCNERLPEEKKFYEENMRSPACLVTVLSDDELMVGIDRTVNGVWTLEETFDKPKIIAWQPLPEPYKGAD